MLGIKRREFGAAGSWPLVGHAQQDGRVRRIGVLVSGGENDPVYKPRVRSASKSSTLRRLSAGVYRFALRFVADESIAENVVNEVFFDVWRKAKLFESRSQVSTWLLGITRNKALETTRRRRPEALDDAACEAIEDAADDPERAIQRKQNNSIVFECLKNLSPAHREIIDIVYYHEKSIDEAAETIRVPRNTVKTRMFYARSHLAKLLAEAGVDSTLLQN